MKEIPLDKFRFVPIYHCANCKTTMHKSIIEQNDNVCIACGAMPPRWGENNVFIKQSQKQQKFKYIPTTLLEKLFCGTFHEWKKVEKN